MSRDFELLQRLEREWAQTAVSESIDPEIAPPKSSEILTIAQERTPAATLPSASLAPIVRNEISKLVVRIFLSAPSKAVAFSGVEAETASQWIAGCTADILAEKVDGRVCLLDADAGSPALHRLYSLSNENGLAAILAGSCTIGDATMRITENLWIIPAGTLPTNMQALTARYRRVIAELQEQFDYLVVCAPDRGKQPELDMLGVGTEGVVLVIDAATTRRAAARNAKAELESAKIRVLGSVFNNRTLPVPEFIYVRM
jgi:Mrp family chromosome partitioning ATPase